MKSRPIIGAKLARPRLPHVLERDRLDRRLLDGVPDHLLTIIVAGPGYGKTTLLASFADKYPAGIIWYSLGPEDADLAVFAGHLVTGLRRQTLRLGTALTTMLREGELSPKMSQSAAGAFLNDTYRIRQPVAVILDDFHLLGEGGPVPDFLTAVLERSKSRIRFMIASRTEPPLPTARLKGRRQVLEVGPGDLSFTKDETRSLLENIHGRRTSEEDLTRLARSTEGWAAALQLVLTGHSTRSKNLSKALVGSVQPGSELHDFLAQEVLDQQPSDLRRWMLASSVFDELDPDILDKIMPEQDVDRGIQHFTRSRLLLPFEGPERVVYRYHGLLLGFLRRRLGIEVPAAERKQLHLDAADALARAGSLLQAGTQLSLSGERERLSQFIKANALALMEQGQYRGLLALLESQPGSVIEKDPWLRLRLGDAHYYLGNLPAAETDYELARMQFRSRNDLQDEAWAVLGLGRIWNLRGQWTRAAAEGEAALILLDQGSKKPVDELLIRLLQVVSGAKFYLGRYDEALELLDRIDLLCKGIPERQAAVWNNRAVIWASQGNYPKAARAFERGLERPGVRELPRASLHLANLALLIDDMGDSERARGLFQEGLRLARRYENQSHVLSCLIGQARMHYRLGDPERSLVALGEAERLNEQLRLPLIQADVNTLRARILCDRQQFQAARSAVRQAMDVYGDVKDANAISYRIEASVVELRAGKLQDARQSLAALEPLTREVEAWYPRAMRLFFLGEAERRLGIPDAGRRFQEALEIAGEMGYDSAVLAELRRSPETICYLLDAEIAVDFVGRVASKIGPDVEPLLLPYLKDGATSPRVLSAVLSILAETGGSASSAAIRSRRWSADLREQSDSVLQVLDERASVAAAPPKGDGAGLQLSVLGGIEVTGPDGKKVPTRAWTSRRALHIFVYLAIKGRRGVSKERLMELFWPGDKVRKAEKNFHPTISYIRKALKNVVSGPVVNAAEGDGYRVQTDPPVVTDLEQFEAALAAAREVEGAQRLRALERGVSLYRGDFLEGSSEGWAEDIRTQLALRFEDALTEIGGLLLDSGGASRALPVFRKLLLRDPYRENVHGKIMMCYHALGDRRAVKEHYLHLCELLRRDLQVEPLPETQRIYKDLST